jgi:hypothetical protein
MKCLNCTGTIILVRKKIRRFCSEKCARSLWQKTNKDKVKKKYKKWRDKNIERERIRLIKYSKDNLEYFRFKSANRRKLVKKATPLMVVKRSMG